MSSNLNSTSESIDQWFVENEDTGAYFSVDKNEPETDEESIELFESFNDFDNTHFTFNLNFLRADFFGQFAFSFVDKFIQDLDLFVLNPQSATDADNPFKPTIDELYQNWSAINFKHSADLYNEYELEYYPLDKSNEFYNYNINVSVLQEKLGDNYYVPRQYLFKTKADKKIVTLSTWTQHIPNLIPNSDYYLLSKEYKKLFRTIKESGIISYETLIDRFGHLFENFEFKNCRIIHPDNSEKAKDIFNSTKFEFDLADFADRLPIDKLVNSKPL